MASASASIATTTPVKELGLRDVVVDQQPNDEQRRGAKRQPCRLGGADHLAHPRQDLIPVGVEEGVLAGANLVDIELVEAGLLVRLDRLDMTVDIRAARRVLGEHVLGHELARLLEVLGRREDLGELARKALVWPQAMDGMPGADLVIVPAHLQATLDDLSLSPAAAELLHRIGVGANRAEPVADPPGELDRLRPEPGDDDRRRWVREVVDARVRDPVVAASMIRAPRPATASE